MPHTTRPQKIALIYAMEAEAMPLVVALGLKSTKPPGMVDSIPFRYFQGAFKGLEITVANNGKDSRHGVDLIGTEPAAVNAYATIQSFRPNVMVSVGTVGSAPELGASIGEVFLGQKFSFHDHRVPLPGWEQLGLGNYPSMDVTDLAKKLRMRVAGISTRNSLDQNDLDSERFRKNQASLEDMESAAIAWVCFVAKVPFFAIKVVSNILSKEASLAEDFEKNLDFTVKALRDGTVRVLESLSI